MTTTTDTCADLGAPAEAEAEAISLYEAIGGRAALVAAVDVFYRRVLADPELSPFFPGGVGDRHRAYLVTFLGEALGGPSRYRGRDMATAHRGLGISDHHFDRVAAHLDATLDELGVPRELTDRIIGIAAGLRPAVVTA
jgi:hemoglobin